MHTNRFLSRCRHNSVQFIQLCLTLCNSIDCSTPGLPVYHQLPPLAQTLVHWVDDAIQPSHPMSPTPSLFLLPSIFTSIRVFSSELVLLIRWPKHWEFQLQPSASVLPTNIQDWFPLGLTGLISLLSKSLLQHHNSKTSVLLSSAFFFFFDPTLKSLNDYWKNHSFD